MIFAKYLMLFATNRRICFRGRWARRRVRRAVCGIFDVWTTLAF